MKIQLHLSYAACRKFLAAAILLLGAVSYGQEFTESNLPIFIITTATDPETGEPMPIPDDPKIEATLKIIWHEDGSTNYVSDQDNEEFLNYNDNIKIELRGSSSQLLEKKQYGWTTYDSEWEKQNVSLLGMPEENDWILNGLAFDASLIRDYLCYNLTRQMGQYATRTQFCEVIINGDYRGLYILQEKIKDDSKRVNIEEITEDDNEGINLTGGYITKADKTTGGDEEIFWLQSYVGWTGFIHEVPKPEDATVAQNNYIQAQFTGLESAAQSEDNSIETGYPSIIDIPTFIDYMIINEFSSNVDAYQISTFFHKDRGGKLRAGPVWDFNLSLGLDVFGERSKTDVWQFSNGDNEGPRFWTDLFNEDTYKCHLARRWSELTQEGQPLHYDSVEAYIDETMEYIHDAAVRNGERWGDIELDPDFEGHVEAMKTWIQERMGWIDANIGTFDACDDVETPPLVISRIDYNPGEDETFPEADDQEFIEITNAGTQTVDLSGVYISELGISYQFPFGAEIGGGEKLYLASNPEIFEAKHGIVPMGQFARNMSNKSLVLELSDAMGNVIDSVEYFDSEPWPDADGTGSYLQLISTDLDNNLASSWMASTEALGHESFESANGIRLFPNPVNDKLSIQSATPVASVAIYDIYGHMVLQGTFGEGTVEIDFSHLSTGVYMVKMTNETGSSVQKVIKE